MADIFAASGAQSYIAWRAAYLASLQTADEEASDTRQAHFAAAVRRALAPRREVGPVDAATALGPAVEQVAEGTFAVDPLHGAGRDEDPDRSEVPPDPGPGS